MSNWAALRDTCELNCIFCEGSTAGATVEHILPESLGGKEWACLPLGLVCADCNQYFGSKVEPFALRSFPFLPFRLLLGISTKHDKPPKMQARVGTLKAGPLPGHIGIDPISSDIEEAIERDRITQLRILAELTEALAVCRLLLKMGLEVVANDSYEAAHGSKFDAARRFARAPSRNSEWWFLLRVDHEKLFRKFICGVSLREWIGGANLEVVEADGAEVFHLRLLDMDLLTPLESIVIPSKMDGLPEPEYRLFKVRC